MSRALFPARRPGNTHVADVAAVSVVAAVVTRQQSKSSAKPSKGSRAAAPRRPGWREAIDGHEGDLAGLACLLVAFVAGLGIYADWSGVVGQALREGIGLLVGWVRLAVPIALVVVGIALIRGRAPVERLRLSTRVRAPHGLGDRSAAARARALRLGRAARRVQRCGWLSRRGHRPPSAERARDRGRDARPRRPRCRRPPDPHARDVACHRGARGRRRAAGARCGSPGRRIDVDALG